MDYLLHYIVILTSVVDLDCDDSEGLDIAFNALDLVGGEQDFLRACGGASNADHSVLSKSFKTTASVVKTLADMGNDLNDLESFVVMSSMDRTRKVELLSETNAVQSSTAAAHAELQGQISTYISQRNTAKRGIISWLNPGVSRKLNPEPINLKEALSYLMKHENYESSGFDVFDLWDQEESVQYNKIMSLLSSRDVPTTTTTRKLDVSSYVRLKEKYFKNDLSNCVDFSKFLDSMKEIISTALGVLEDIRMGNKTTSFRRGKSKNVMFSVCFHC